MADVTEFKNDSPNKTILRVKRKRSEDPADLLLVCHAFKKFLTEEEQLSAAAENKSNSVQRVFRLAGTVSKGDSNFLSPEVMTRLKYRGRHKSKVKAKLQNDVIVEAINDKLRETKKLSSQKARYKVISKHRREKEKPRELSENESSGKSDVDATTEEILRLYQLYDIVLDETEPALIVQVSEVLRKTVDGIVTDVLTASKAVIFRVREAKGEKESVKIDEDPNAILCNSVKMIREKLNIDTGASKHSNLLDKDFVYDVYCAEDNYGDISEDVLDIVRVNESQLVSEVDEDLETYDDEDDSNDENNWRNDYPDEDDQGESSEEESRYKSKNFDYGWEGRYGTECGQKMFSENFSSDEDQDFAYFGKKYGESRNDEDEYNFEIVDEED